MYSTVKALSVLALAGTTLAAPSNLERRGGWGGWKWGGNWGGNAAPSAAWTNWASTATVYVTGAAPTTPAPAPPAPAPPTSAAPATTPAPSAGQFYPSPPSGGFPSGGWSSAPPAASPTSSGSAPSTNDGSWQSVVAEWRGKEGLPALTPDSQLVANAQKTVDESVGGLKHELNPGTFAQVLAPGQVSEFEHVYVGGWLCEMPDLPGLNGVCAEQSKGWSYEGQTGHAEILSSTKYTKIGCAHSDSTGVWGCDLA